MKRLICAVAAALLIASCTSQSGDRAKNSVRRVVKEMYLANDSTWVAFPDKEIKMVDNLFGVGDTITFGNKTYLIIK